MPKTTEDIISDSIIQLQELAEFDKDLERKYHFTGYVFSTFLAIKECNIPELEKKKQYLLGEIPNLKEGKNTWKIFTEALEGLHNLVKFSQNPIKKYILKKPIEEVVEESRVKVKKIQKELGKTDTTNLAKSDKSEMVSK